MTLVLVDTGAWIALLSRDDQYATAATEHYRHLRAAGARLVTTNYVVDETATRLRYGAGLAAALAFKNMLDSAVEAKFLRVLSVDETIERAAWRVLERYADATLSLTDATSIAVAQKARVGEVFSFDRDFEAAGLLVQPLR